MAFDTDLENKIVKAIMAAPGGTGQGFYRKTHVRRYCISV